MTVAILQPGYLPWLGAFEQMARADVFVFYDDVQYTKSDWRNRNRIKGPNGAVWLTVPVLTKGRREQRICEAEIAGDAWRTKHWRTIEAAYRASPHFDRYADELRAFYERPWRLIAELNVALTRWMAEKLGLSPRFVLSSALGVRETDRNRRIVAVTRAVGADLLYDGKSARAFIDTALFAREHIRVEFQDYRHPVYPQQWPRHGFIPHLSAVDLLFNCGPESLRVLTGG